VLVKTINPTGRKPQLQGDNMKESIPDILTAIAIGIGFAVLLASWWLT